MRKWIRWALVPALLLALTGCDGGGAEPYLACAEVTNPGGASYCGSAPAAADTGTAAPLSTITLGDVSRGTNINGTAVPNNPLSVEATVQLRMEFDGGCNGAPTWEILGRQAFVVPPTSAIPITVGGSCGDMPLGPRVLEVDMYSADGATLTGQIFVEFNLVP